MCKRLTFILFLSSLTSFGQITNKPFGEKKSSQETKITSIELTEKETIVSLEFKTQSSKNQLKEFLDQNPGLKSQLDNIPRSFREKYIEQLLQNLEKGGSSVSFQPTSFLRTEKGRKLKFIRVNGIPQAPERKEVVAGEVVSFKVFFERVPKGVEKIDLIESEDDTEDGFSYWNFYNIRFINPADGEVSTATNNVLSPTIVFGKLLDMETNKPVRGRVVYLDAATQQGIDSVQTSGTGSFDFLVNVPKIILKVEAEGYIPFELTTQIRENASEKPLQLYIQPLTPDSDKKIMGNETPLFSAKDGLNGSVDKSFVLDEVYFATGQSEILPTSFEQLEKLVNYLKENPTIEIQIEGHTDTVGDASLNKKLSLDRAFRVREYLISKGIAGTRLKFIGKGDTEPLVSNDTEENRQMNRRVEFKIISSEIK
jgi:outer membrane protein OmpA-like peptidoglycan-associated protein